MKTLFFCCFCWLSLAATPLKAQTCSLTTTERETPGPQADPELRGLARQQAAVLTDLLLLNQLQAHYLQKALYERFWQLRVQEEAQPDGQPVPAATAKVVLRSYYHCLLGVLSPNQYATLLRLEGNAVPPFAPIAHATRYVPAGRLLARDQRSHRP
jgi:hypothetical protein